MFISAGYVQAQETMETDGKGSLPLLHSLLWSLHNSTRIKPLPAWRWDLAIKPQLQQWQSQCKHRDDSHSLWPNDVTPLSSQSTNKHRWWWVSEHWCRLSVPNTVTQSCDVQSKPDDITPNGDLTDAQHSDITAHSCSTDIPAADVTPLISVNQQYLLSTWH